MVFDYDTAVHVPCCEQGARSSLSGKGFCSTLGQSREKTKTRLDRTTHVQFCQFARLCLGGKGVTGLWKCWGVLSLMTYQVLQLYFVSDTLLQQLQARCHVHLRSRSPSTCRERVWNFRVPVFEFRSMETPLNPWHNMLCPMYELGRKSIAILRKARDVTHPTERLLRQPCWWLFVWDRPILVALVSVQGIAPGGTPAKPPQYETQ